MNKSIQDLMTIFDGSFINNHNELILIPKTNLYFRLEDVKSDMDLKCKIIAWCSRHACKTMPYSVQWRNKKYQAEVRERLNKYLGVDFDKDDWMYIYTCFGNDINRPFCELFVDSNFDLSFIKAVDG